MGENACIKSMGGHDDGCSSKKLTDLPRDNSQKTRIINNLRHDLLDGGAGGGGGASYVFLVRCLVVCKVLNQNLQLKLLQLNQVNKAVPLIVAGGGGGLSVGRYLDENVQQAKGIVLERPETTGQIENDNFEELKSAGPGGKFNDLLSCY